MFFLRICLMAWQALRANLLRSLLATLGVIIGVAAVISAMSILEGARKDVMDRFRTFGSDLVIVTPPRVRAGGRVTRRVDTLSLEDAEAIQTECPSVLRTAPELWIAGVVVKHGSRNKSYFLLGTNENYASMQNYRVQVGRFISPDDVRSERKVAVLGHGVAKYLFGEADPVGFTVKIKGVGFRVVGVMEKKGTLGFRNVDNQVVIPITTAMRRLFGVRYVADILVQAREGTSLETCQDEIKRVLRKRHRIRPGQKDDFDMFTQEEVRRQFNEVTQIFAVVLYSIAGISLVVGGIGIMNIMLVSVTERTREIGVRMAVGAQRWDILRQFLIESSTISLLGGAFGVLLGFAFNNLIEKATTVLETYTPPTVVAWALAMAVLTGICSGIYPAYKASRLDPVEALRYE